MKIVVAVLCIVCVLAICIAPTVDLPVTALRSLRGILLMMLALGAALILSANLFHRVILRRAYSKAGPEPPRYALLLPFEANCVQQC